MAGNIKFRLLEPQNVYTASNDLYRFINFLASSKSDFSERIGKDKISELVNQVLRRLSHDLLSRYFKPESYAVGSKIRT